MDHVYSFFYADDKIWFRHYQIVEKEVAKQLGRGGIITGDEITSAAQDPILVEVGPRFVFDPVRIFQDSFAGKTIWKNKKYVSPAHVCGFDFNFPHFTFFPFIDPSINPSTERSSLCSACCRNEAGTRKKESKPTAYSPSRRSLLRRLIILTSTLHFHPHSLFHFTLTSFHIFISPYAYIFVYRHLTRTHMKFFRLRELVQFFPFHEFSGCIY